MPGFIDAEGKQQEVKLEASIYKEAAKAGLTVPQHINKKFPTAANMKATTFEQMCYSSGLIMKPDAEFGIRTPTLGQIFDGGRMEAGVAVRDADPASRILFPSVIIELVENKLQVDRTKDVNAFNQMIAVDTSVVGSKVERPVINYTGPEAGRSKPIAQLAKPASMLKFTTSDTSFTIPTFALGMEASDEALAASTLDLVALSIARQVEVERNARTYEYLAALKDGDADTGDAALSAITAASLDSSITAAGTITHKAWVKFLDKDSYKRNIDYCVTDLDTYLAIENRTGKPTVQTDDPNSPRVDSLTSIVNRNFNNVKFFIVDPDKTWPANTIMGIDSRYAIHRYRNSAAAYSAAEEFVLTKSQALRFDFAEVVFRFQDEAFEVVTLTV